MKTYKAGFGRTQNILNGNKPSKLGIVTPILLRSGLNPTLNLLRILKSLDKNGFWVLEVAAEASLRNSLVGSSRCHYKTTYHRQGLSGVSQVLNYIRTEFHVAMNIATLHKEVQTWIFYGEHSPLPMITAKLLGKTIVLVTAANPAKILEKVDRRHYYVGYTMSYVNFLLSQCLILYSPRLIDEWNLERYRHKILIAHEHFLDFNTFTVTTPLADRPPLIGYIGRLSGEKGVQNFTQALPAILSDQQDLSVFIGGDGQLREAIEASLQQEGFTTRVDLPGWISHDDLPKYLNQLRLLVLPSYTEGLPNIMLEAMACGTPVLATPVGAIPDIIIDGKTGFIMENNSPECIAENVIRALDSPDLERIAEEGRRFVEENFSFEKTVENWKGILQNIE